MDKASAGMAAEELLEFFTNGLSGTSNCAWEIIQDLMGEGEAPPLQEELVDEARSCARRPTPLAQKDINRGSCLIDVHSLPPQLGVTQTKWIDEEDVHGVSDVSAGMEWNAIGKLLGSQTHSTHGLLQWEYVAPMAMSKKGAGPVADARVKEKVQDSDGTTESYGGGVGNEG
ncbi:hypothetical protein BKA83DRAFT_4127181 [Pisolithus microcarpus]|nr:hypothetical protein BKA83DRAFT_4127181 [Pisolithus microcarpus]